MKRVPFGIGETKPHHYLEMGKIAWANRGKWGYAMRVLRDGVCDGCALGTSGLSDWTIDGTHLCLVRLNLLRLNTMDAIEDRWFRDVEALPRDGRALRDLGRLPYPMRRRPGERGFTRLSWDEAIAEIGVQLAATDPERAALYMTSRGITNEVYFAAQKAWRAYGSPHIDNAARLCHSPSTAAMKATMGVSASTCSYRDWYEADVIVFFGSNPANDQPVALKYLYEAKKRHDTKVLVVNTYEEPGMKRYWIPSNADSAVLGTEVADRFFQVSAGGDLAFIQAVQKILIGRRAIDGDFIDEHTDGWTAYEAGLAAVSLEELVARSGARMEDVVDFASAIDHAKTGVFVWSMGITQHEHGTSTVEAICALGMSQGFVGRRGCGMMPIRGHSGVQGGAEMGAYATVFPARPIDEESADELERLWGFRPPVKIGLDTAAMLDAARAGELDVLYAIGGNFLDTLPDPDHVRVGLEAPRMRVHQDIFLNTSMLVPAAEAVYLLPARTRYEHEGGVTETSTERRVIYSPHIPGHSVGEARDEWRILCDIVAAARPDRADAVRYADTHAIRADIARTIARYAPIADLRAKGDQFQWGGPRLCEGGYFETPNRRGKFFYHPAPDRRLPTHQFHLATRRGKQFNSMVQADTDTLTGAARDHVFIHPDDMQRVGVRQDQALRLVNEHGTFTGRAFAAPMTRGSLQMHWPEANVLLPRGRRDPGGLVPDYNAIVTLEPR